MRNAHRGVIEQRRDENPKARAHLGWQFEIPHNPHSFMPRLPAGVPRVIATLAKSQIRAHPNMQCFFPTPEDWQRDTTFGEAPSRLESEHSDA
jgi:hypothetical protein